MFAHCVWQKAKGSICNLNFRAIIFGASSGFASQTTTAEKPRKIKIGKLKIDEKTMQLINEFMSLAVCLCQLSSTVSPIAIILETLMSLTDSARENIWHMSET